MTANEAAIRKAYQVAEDKDVVGWVNCFTKDGTFTDESIGVTYRGPNELGRPVEIYGDGVSRHASRAVQLLRRRRYSRRRTRLAGNPQRSAGIASGNRAADRKADGCTVL
jgi:hypothetical protein